MKTKTPRAPVGLSSDSRRLWKQLHQNYDLTDPVGLHWLETALRANDLRLEAEKALSEDGVTRSGRDPGTLVRHPAALVWKDAQTVMLNAFRMLDLALPGTE